MSMNTIELLEWKVLNELKNDILDCVITKRNDRTVLFFVPVSNLVSSDKNAYKLQGGKHQRYRNPYQ